MSNVETLRQKLEAEVHKCQWKDLIPHAARGSVVVVDSRLDLVDVAVAVAQDETTQVKDWMSTHQVGRLTDAQLATWNEMQEKPFQMVVVAPYILVQEAAH